MKGFPAFPPRSSATVLPFRGPWTITSSPGWVIRESWEEQVIAGKGCCDYSYWGDFRSFCARTAGAAGVVIDGAFRDVEECREIGLPVFARAVTCITAAKKGTGSINVPVSCGGVCVRPGEIIVGDENGVCVIDPEEAEVIMEKAEKKRAAQEQVVREIRKTGILRTRIKK